ncbi:MAG: TonB family protein [bacterium]|nr:TonB family protein [bacterium]
MWGPFAGSVGLHVTVAVIMVIASGAGQLKTKPLPSATVVKLVRPMTPPQGTPGKTGEAPKTKPALEIPKADKSKKPKPTDVQTPPKPESAQRSSSPTTTERTGEAGTLRVSGGGFEYDFYLAVVQSKIEQNFRPPPGMRGQSMATVGFSIQKSGLVSNVTLAKSSGNLLIDQAAERAVRAAGRFPPLPPQYSQGQLDIYFEFVVNPAAGH